MKRLFSSMVILIALLATSCSNSNEKVHDTIYVAATPGAEVTTTELQTAEPVQEGGTYSMLDVKRPPEPSKRNETRRAEAAAADAPVATPAPPPADTWKNFTLDGYTEGGGKRFPIKITGQKKETANGTSYRNCKYKNINYNVTFAVDVYENYGQLTITRSSDPGDMRIEAYRSGSGWDGSMSTRTNTLPLHFN